MKISRVLTLVSVLAVLGAYAYFGSNGRLRFPLVSWTDSYYGSQAEGFLRGQLNMAHEAPPALAALPDPYSREARQRAGVHVPWDVSYFDGKYYLYFSPVPALLFDIPVRLVTGAYPTDPAVTTLCAMIGFVLFVLTLHRALRETQVPLFVWILLLGIGNVIPFVLIRTSVYQVPIACGMMFTGGLAYALLRFLEMPSVRGALAMGACTALAIASRPNLGVLIFIVLAVILRATPRHELAKIAFAFLAPLVVVGSAMLLFNYARFRSPFEFGICYQLANVRAEDCAHCSVRNSAEVLRLANSFRHYVFWVPAIHSGFPYLELQKTRLDRAVSYRGKPEPVAGIVPLTPLVLLGSAFAVLLMQRNVPLDTATRAGVALIACGWIVLLGLSSCRWVTARFALDFTGLLIAGAAICTEARLTFLASTGVSTRPLRIACIVMAVLSIVAGWLLPFSLAPWA